MKRGKAASDNEVLSEAPEDTIQNESSGAASDQAIHPVRPGAVITTRFGHDVDPALHVYRFHRALDRSGGDGLVYCPMTARGAVLEAPSTPAFGTLIRLIYAGYEIRIAHCEEFDSEFFDLVSAKRPIPAGMIIAPEGAAGKSVAVNSNYPEHSHIELVAIGGRNKTLDAALIAQGGTPGEYWTEDELVKASGGKHKGWMREYGATKLGPYECIAWDRRTNGWAIWMDPAAVLGL